MSGKVEPLDRKEILATMKMLAGGQELIALLHSQEDRTESDRLPAKQANDPRLHPGGMFTALVD